MLSPVWRKQSHQQWSQVHRVDRFQSTEDRKGNFLVRGELQLRDNEAQSGHLDGFICWPKDTCTLQRWVCLGVLIIGCDIIAKNWRGSVALNTNDSFHFLKVIGMQTGTQVSPNDQPRGTDTKCKAPDTLSLCSVWGLHSSSLAWHFPEEVLWLEIQNQRNLQEVQGVETSNQMFCQENSWKKWKLPNEMKRKRVWTD